MPSWATDDERKPVNVDALDSNADWTRKDRSAMDKPLRFHSIGLAFAKGGKVEGAIVRLTRKDSDEWQVIETETLDQDDLVSLISEAAKILLSLRLTEQIQEGVEEL